MHLNKLKKKRKRSWTFASFFIPPKMADIEWSENWKNWAYLTFLPLSVIFLCFWICIRKKDVDCDHCKQHDKDGKIASKHNR